jgi:hypothetical protein
MSVIYRRIYALTSEFGKAALFFLLDPSSYITISSIALEGGFLKTVC